MVCVTWQQAQAGAGYFATNGPQNGFVRRLERLMPRPTLPDWTADGRVLSVLVNIERGPRWLPPEILTIRCRKS